MCKKPTRKASSLLFDNISIALADEDKTPLQVLRLG